MFECVYQQEISGGGSQGSWFSSFMGTFHREKVNVRHTDLDLPKNKWELCSQEMCVCLVCLPRKLEFKSNERKWIRHDWTAYVSPVICFGFCRSICVLISDISGFKCYMAVSINEGSRNPENCWFVMEKHMLKRMI